MGRCIVYYGIGQLLLIHPFISSFFFLSNFQTLKFFLTLFSGTVRPRRLKLCTCVDSGQMYYVYQNQAAASYWSFISSFFFLSNFQTLKFFVTFLETVRPRRLKIGTHMDSGQMYHVYQKSGCCCLFIPLFLHFFFLSNFQHWSFSSHFSLELWGPSYSSLNVLLFLFANIQTLKIFVTLFSGTVRPRRLKLVAQLKSGCFCIFIPFFHFSFPIFKH